MGRCGHEVPPRSAPVDDNGYFEELTKAVFRAGFSWRVVHDRWPGFQAAFDGFDIERVAAYDEPYVDRLLSDERIVRNGRKIEATIHNARALTEIVAQHGSFRAYLRSLDGQPYSKRRTALSRRFKNLGPTGVFTFLYSVDEEVPDWEDRNK